LGGYVYHHKRFYAGLLLGVAVYVSFWLAGWPAPLAAAGDSFFLFYLIASALFFLSTSSEDLRSRAAREDEGIHVVVVITLLIVAVNVIGVFLALNSNHTLTPLEMTIILAAAPLGWFVLHTIAAFHYANMHYFDPPGDAGPGRALLFPGTETPGVWDFLYFSFVIGMTAQVSDVQVCTTGMRKAVTGHSIVSFFFNTVLLALVVNAVVAGH